MNRHLSLMDRALVQADRALRTLSANTRPHFHQSPATELDEPELSDSEKRLSASLMRVNHTGEVCAQALYQGQAATAKLEDVRQEMETAADEEIDHLAWCEDRLRDLDSRPSLLNPLFYGLSFGMGATAGLVSDRVSLGFVAATEDQVCKHLQDHLQRLPEQDDKSRTVVEQMLNDEADHASKARQAGAVEFPAPVKAGMTLVSKVMTWSSFRI